jgi:hypothetical protein
MFKNNLILIKIEYNDKIVAAAEYPQVSIGF